MITTTNKYWKLGAFKRTIPFTNLAGGSLLTLMGVITVWYGMSYTSMSPASGWQAQTALWLQETGQRITQALAWMPNWLMAAILLSLLLGLAWLAITQVTALHKDYPDEDAALHHQDCHQHPKH